MSAAVAISRNALELQMSAHESSKMSRYLVTFFKRVDKFKVYTLNKLKIINFFLHDIIEWLKLLIEKINFVKLGSKFSNFQPLMNQVRFARIARSNQIYKNAVFFEENNLLITLVKVKRNLLRCTRCLPKLLIRHKSGPNVMAKSNRKCSRVLQKIGKKAQLKT